MIQTPGRIGRLVMRVQTAVLDKTTLSLTLSAAQMRFAVDQATCAAVLGMLADAGVLTERKGAYRRHLPRSAARAAA